MKSAIKYLLSFVFHSAYIFLLLIVQSAIFNSPASGAVPISKTDSLLSLLKKDNGACPEPCIWDTNKVNVLNDLAWELRSRNPDSAIVLSAQALDLSEKIKWETGIGKSNHCLGVFNRLKGDYATSLAHYFKALAIRKKLLSSSSRSSPDWEELEKNVSSTLGNIGIVYDDQADYPKALDYYFKALKMDEELENKNGIIRHLGNIGFVYYEQADYPKALDYYFKALKLAEELGNKNGIAINLGNIGIVYKQQADYPKVRPQERDSLLSKSLDYYFKAMKIAQELGDKNGIARHLGNIGNIYFNKTDYPKALDYYFKALKLAEELGNKNGIAIKLGNIGSLYIKTGKFIEAEKYLKHSIALCDSIKALDVTREFEQFLSHLYDTTGRYKLALEHYKKAMTLKDTIFSQEEKKQLVRKEMNYEFEKKEAAARAEQDKKDAVASAESKKEKVIRYSVIGGLVLMFAVALVIFRSLKITRRQKYIIEKQKDEVWRQKEIVEIQKEEISHKNKNLTDSINYAQRIQSAILTSEQYLNDMFLPKGQTASHFILYKPKDIVAGDFYWAYSTTDFGFAQSAESIPVAERSRSHRLCIWVTADCTGHGVPGAFMSMIGNSLLNEIVVEKGIHEPDQILNRMREGVIKALGQGVGAEEKRKDGLDATVCIWDKKTNKLSFAGANNALWLVRKETDESENEPHTLPLSHFPTFTLSEVQPDSQPVGQHLVMNPFTKKEILLQKGDTLYTFTDGYCDQFGGPKGKKFKYKPFKELLISIQDKSMGEQKEIINNVFEKWKGNLEQIDDICVFGVRV